ncbi:hypothetical protein TNCV_1383981 [Trichonephila clavipes]|nr:hypothetical protein TNCV_1383981 [Trichonephila clavipes]
MERGRECKEGDPMPPTENAHLFWLGQIPCTKTSPVFVTERQRLGHVTGEPFPFEGHSTSEPKYRLKWDGGMLRVLVPNDVQRPKVSQSGFD